jgi:hypothetical protein
MQQTNLRIKGGLVINLATQHLFIKEFLNKPDLVGSEVYDAVSEFLETLIIAKRDGKQYILLNLTKNKKYNVIESYQG